MPIRYSTGLMILGLLTTLTGCPEERCVAGPCDGPGSEPPTESEPAPEPVPAPPPEQCPLESDDRRIAEALVVVVDDAQATLSAISHDPGHTYAAVGKPLLFGEQLYFAGGNERETLCAGGAVAFAPDRCRREYQSELPPFWDGLDECEDIECHGEGLATARVGVTRFPNHLGSEPHAIEYSAWLDDDTPARVRYHDNPIFETVLEHDEERVFVTRDDNYEVTVTLEDGSAIEMNHRVHLEAEVDIEGNYEGTLAVEIPSAFSQPASIEYRLSSEFGQNEGELVVGDESVVVVASNGDLAWPRPCYREQL